MTLECQAAGDPPPQISWLKNGRPLLLSPRTRLLSGDTVLRSVQTEKAECIDLHFINTGEVMLSVSFLYGKGFPLCSCLTREFTHVWRAVELDSLSSAMMSRFKVCFNHNKANTLFFSLQ